MDCHPACNAAYWAICLLVTWICRSCSTVGILLARQPFEVFSSPTVAGARWWCRASWPVPIAAQQGLLQPDFARRRGYRPDLGVLQLSSGLVLLLFFPPVSSLALLFCRVGFQSNAFGLHQAGGLRFRQRFRVGRARVTRCFFRC